MASMSPTHYLDLPPSFSLRDIVTLAEFCAIECEKQGSGEMSVFHMMNGWAYLYERQDEPVTEDLIIGLAGLVEPRFSTNGVSWRRVDVRVGLDVKPRFDRVPELMAVLIEQWDAMDPAEWYRAYEEVHPLPDGNGRTGNLLYNLRRGTLHPSTIVFPPNFWGYHDGQEIMEGWNRDQEDA